MSGNSTSGTDFPVVKKRKRSRWGSELSVEQQKANADAVIVATSTAEGQEGPGSARKKSRWGGKAAVPPSSAVPAGGLAEVKRETLATQIKLQDINKKLAQPWAPNESGDRSPSPEPIYNADGQRTNTRQQRWIGKLMADRTECIKKILELNPSMQIRLPAQKAVKKIPIPQARYPDYNFIGLIIGPRGNTQKRMERETGAKIVIRGKGANKGGKKRDQRPMEGDDEELHVHISGNSQESVDKATILIEQLLVPQNESANVHKAKQLQELAAINGTQRDSLTCKVCGEMGHKIYQCPNRSGAKWTAADVLCGICGSTSHPDRDCPKAADKGMSPATAGQSSMTKEYENFMAELTGEGRAVAGQGAGSGSSFSQASRAPSHTTGSSGESSAVPSRPKPEAFIHPSRRIHHTSSSAASTSSLATNVRAPALMTLPSATVASQNQPSPPMRPPGMSMPPMMMPGAGFMPYPMMIPPPLYFPPPPFGIPNPWNLSGALPQPPPPPAPPTP